MEMFEPFLTCLGIRPKIQRIVVPTTFAEPKYYDHYQPQSEVDAAAHDFVNILLNANTNDFTDWQLRKNLHTAVSTLSWSENLASAIVTCLEAALRNGLKLGRTVELATEKAVAAAVGFAKEHPVYFTLIATGVLALTVPWVLGWLGFGEIGIVEGRSRIHARKIMLTRMNRIVGSSMASSVRWICTQRLVVLLFPTSGYGLALEDRLR